MTHRFAAALTLALTLSIPAAALADVPPAADGGTGGAANTDCTVGSQEQSGSTCEICQIQAGDDSSCGQELGGDYSLACTISSTQEVWCNGPARNDTPDPGCALTAPPAPAGKGAMVVSLLGLVTAVWAMRRRQRS
jgi:hypothetical protein